MPPRAPVDSHAGGIYNVGKGYSNGPPSNRDVMPHAGEMVLNPAKPWGKGIVDDFQANVVGHWWSQIKTLNQRTIAVTLLVFITVMAPTVAFGAVYGKVTDNHFGAVETILGTAWVGIVYALIGGMPLVSPEMGRDESMIACD
jgi:HCO3- transporter family